jgi:hypothetical protein
MEDDRDGDLEEEFHARRQSARPNAESCRTPAQRDKEKRRAPKRPPPYLRRTLAGSYLMTVAPIGWPKPLIVLVGEPPLG